MKHADFSLRSIIAAIAMDSWRQGPMTPERRIHAKLCERFGVRPGEGHVRLPDFALRDLDLTEGASIVATATSGYLPALQPASVALRLGAQTENLPAGAKFARPAATAGVSVTWLETETSQAAETEPTFGTLSGEPHILSAYCQLSRHMVSQATNSERIIRTEFRNAAATALDAAVLNGSGASGQPLGILQTPGIGAFTGASVSQAALRSAQRDVCEANAVVSGLGYVTTPAVAELLATRQRFAGSDRTLWEGSSHAGTVESAPAYGTGNMPASTILCGDFSRLLIVQWGGGLVLEVDPFTDFKAGIIGVRLLFPLDIVVTRPQAFSAASSVT